jgi:drug/metabolite transporter (DMT)-like permease
MHFLSRLSPKTIGIAAAIVTITVWTSFIVVARFMALRGLTPLDIVLCRMLGAAMVLLPWGYFMVRKMRREGQANDASGAAQTWIGLSPLPWRIVWPIGLFGGVGYAVLAYTAFTFAPAAHGSVLMPGMLPLTTALLSVLFFKEQLSTGRKLGLAMIFGGAVLVGGVSIFQALVQNAGKVWVGDVLFVCASTTWATYTVLCRKYALSAVPATIAVIVFCVVTYVPFYAVAVWLGVFQSKLATAPWGEIAFQTLWQGGGSVVISGISFTKMVQYFGPIRSTMLTAVVPGLSAMGAVIFLGEPLYWNLIAGLCLVTAGIVVGVRASARVVKA